MKRILSILAGSLLLLAPAAHVAHAAPAEIEAAKASGVLGETAQGYLEFVQGRTDAALSAEVEEINILRRQEYTRLAGEQGTSVDAVAIVTGEKLIARAPAGQWYRNANGQWVQK